VKRGQLIRKILENVLICLVIGAISAGSTVIIGANAERNPIEVAEVYSISGLQSTGKGIWIWKLWEVENGDVSKIIQKLNSANVNWVTIKCGDSDSFWTKTELTPEKINQFHDAGIKVFGWHFVYSYDYWEIPDVSEADVSNRILDIPGIDGLIINAEGDYEGPDKGPIAEQYLIEIRNKHPSSFIAYSSFARVDGHEWFPWLEFGRYSDVNMPQAYWQMRPTTPEEELRLMKEQFDKWHKIWEDGGFGDSVKPIIPVGQGWDVSGDEIKRFYSRAIDDYEYQGMSLFRYGTMNEEMWNAYATCGPSQPDLTPYKPLGPPEWSDKIVVSKTTGTHTDDPNLTPDDTLYVDWAVANQGDADITNRFYYYLYVDGGYVEDWHSDSLRAGYYAPVEDYSIGKLSAGNHTITIVADPTDVVSESDESNNEYTKNISITSAETISKPGTPTGDTNPTVGVSYTYTTSGATSSKGHTLEYRFDWDDGSYSSWSTSKSASHSWSSTGQYTVKVTARCQTHTDKTNTSDGLVVNVQQEETISKPGTPTGDTNPTLGVSYTYTTSGATSSKGHTVEYQFDWDDGSYSSWSTSKSASHSWSSIGQKTVKVTARCQTHTDKTNISDGLLVIPGGEPISGTITDGTTPIAATVEAWQNGTLVRSTDTPDGSYVLHLPPGAYAIRAYSAGYYAAVLPDEITPPATNVNLSLTQAPTVATTNFICDFWCQDNTKFDWQNPHIPVLVQIGDVITAQDPDGIICGITTVGESGTDEGDYFIHVYGDDATTPGVDEGAIEGDTITSFINGYPASVISGTPQWHSGSSFEVCLEGPKKPAEIPLCAGWNFFSFNVEPPNKDIETVLASIDGLYTYVRGMECGGKALTYDPSRPFNDLEQLEPLHGYEIKMSSDAILPVTGMPVSVTTPIALCAGWNFISYLPDVPCPTEEALASIDGLYTYVRGMECGGKALTYDPSRPFNDLEQLEPLHGYEIKMSSDGTLVYPTSSSLLAFMRTSVPEKQEPSSNQVLISNLAPALSSEAISGTVTDGVDPIQNATVQAWQNNQKIQETTTAPDGSYTLSGLAAGTYIVRAHKEGFYATYLDNQPAPSNGVNIVLESLPSIISTNLVCDFWSMDSATYSGEQPLLPIGDVVTAIDPDGVICGVTTVGEFGTDEGDFFLHVYGDDATTPGVDEGAVEGDTITLMLNKYYPIKDVNPQPVWHASDSIQLTLAQFDRTLPVGLSAVTATWIGDQIILSWQTQSETNNLGWDVYRSLRKDGTYRKINAAMIAGAGTSAEPHTYQFVDEHVEAGNAYFYYLENIDFDGKRHKSHLIQVEMLTTLGQIKYSALYPNFPNPFNPETWIPFKLASDSPVVIDIYDIKGKLVKRLDLGHKEAGYYLDRRSAAHWDGRSQTGERVASGIYLYTIKAGKFTATRRMVVVK